MGGVQGRGLFNINDAIGGGGRIGGKSGPTGVDGTH